MRSLMGFRPISGREYFWILAVEPIPNDGRIAIFIRRGDTSTMIGVLPNLNRRRRSQTLWSELKDRGKHLYPLMIGSIGSGEHIAREIMTYWRYQFQADGYTIYDEGGRLW